MMGFWIVLAARLVQMATAFVALRVMTELLGPTELGRYAIIISVTTFFALVFINPAGMYFNRRLHAWNESATVRGHFLKFSFYVGAVGLFAAVSVPVFGLVAGPSWPVEASWLAGLAAASILFTTLNQTIIPALNLLERRTSWLVFSTLTLWLALGLSSLLTLKDPRAELWQVGQILGFAIGAVIAIPYFFRTLNREPKKADEVETASKILRFAVPLAISVGLYWCQFQSYRLVVGQWISIETLGGFMGIYTLVAGLMSAFENLVQQYLYPHLYAQSSTDDPIRRANAWRRYATLAVPMIALAGLALYAAHASFIRLFLAESFHQYSAFAMIAIFVETCRAIGSAYGMAGQISYRTQALLFPQLAAVLLLLLLTPYYFSESSRPAPESFLFALGIPATVYVALSALVTRVKLDMKFPARMLNPVLIGGALAFGIASLASVVSASFLGNVFHLALCGALFGALAIWIVMSWRRYEKPLGRELRIVHIVRAPAGGIRLHVLELMKATGVQQWLVTNISDEDSAFRERRKDPTFADRLITLSIAEQPGLSDVKNLVKLYFALRKIRPDIIHGHGAKGGLYARILADSLFARAAYSAHGGSLHKAFSPAKQTLYNFVERVLALKTDAALFESDYSRRMFSSHVANLGVRGHLVPNGLPLEPAKQKIVARGGRPIVLGTFGLLRHMKGQDILIETVPHLVKRGYDVRVLLHGDGPQRGEFVDLASKLGIAERVEFVGDVADPLARMAACDIVVQPSRHESFGYTAVEAMMVGTPVVASAVGGLIEIIEDGVTGFLASEASPEGFAAKIDFVIKNPDLSANVVTAARKKVESLYDAERMRQQVLDVYRRTCSV